MKLRAAARAADRIPVLPEGRMEGEAEDFDFFAVFFGRGQKDVVSFSDCF